MEQSNTVPVESMNSIASNFNIFEKFVEQKLAKFTILPVPLLL